MNTQDQAKIKEGLKKYYAGTGSPREVMDALAQALFPNVDFKAEVAEQHLNEHVKELCKEKQGWDWCEIFCDDTHNGKPVITVDLDIDTVGDFRKHVDEFDMLFTNLAVKHNMIVRPNYRIFGTWIEPVK